MVHPTVVLATWPGPHEVLGLIPPATQAADVIAAHDHHVTRTLGDASECDPKARFNGRGAVVSSAEPSRGKPSASSRGEQIADASASMIGSSAKSTRKTRAQCVQPFTAAAINQKCQRCPDSMPRDAPVPGSILPGYQGFSKRRKRRGLVVMVLVKVIVPAHRNVSL